MTAGQNLQLPRILCLHGGGTNKRIFRAQCRKLIAELEFDFRFVFAEASFPSPAGPDVLSAYREWGPFKAWLPWSPGYNTTVTTDVISRLEESLNEAMMGDDALGATGDWIALLGFSQGAKACASLLKYQERTKHQINNPMALPHFRFGIIIAGRGPMLPFSETPSTQYATYGSSESEMNNDAHAHSSPVLMTPTLHVHGARDPGLHMHQAFYNDYFDESSRRLIVWDGDHRVPLKKCDVDILVREILLLHKIAYSH